jgi:hypothetical protein
MRVEAVQNERRPYNPSHTNTTQRWETISNNSSPSQRLRKSYETASLNSVSTHMNIRCLFVFNFCSFSFFVCLFLKFLIGASNGIYPLTSFLANLTNHRDETVHIDTKENKHHYSQQQQQQQQQPTLHSILTSTTRIQSPTATRKQLI